MIKKSGIENLYKPLSPNNAVHVYYFPDKFTYLSLIFIVHHQLFIGYRNSNG